MGIDSVLFLKSHEDFLMRQAVNRRKHLHNPVVTTDETGRRIIRPAILPGAFNPNLRGRTILV